MSEMYVKKEELNAPVCNGISEVQPLSSMLDDALNLTAEAVQMTNRINQHLFGIGQPKEEEFKPLCFRDVLGDNISQLGRLCENLSKICVMLGV